MNDQESKKVGTDIANDVLKILENKESSRSVPRELSESVITHLRSLNIKEEGITNVKLELGLNNDSSTNDDSLNDYGGINVEKLIITIMIIFGVDHIVTKTITKVLETGRAIEIRMEPGISVIIPPRSNQ